MTGSKVGRNDACLCGSGKKFKKCHGASTPAPPVAPVASSRSRPAPLGSPLGPNETSGSVPMGGFPGQTHDYTVVNEFVDKRPSDLVGQPGDYKVVFVLSRPGRAPRGDRDISFNLAPEGDSHLSINASHLLPPGTEGAGVKKIHLHHMSGGRIIRLTGIPNERGFLASVEVLLAAPTMQAAAIEATRALTPALSTWSISLNVPLFIQQLEVTEVRTGNIRISATTPFFDAPATNISNEPLSEDFLWFAALYREALNANSPLYRFLCVYKIIEGVTVRRSTTKIYPKAKERVPDDEREFNGWLHALFPVRPERWDEMTLDTVFIPEARGRKVGDIRDKDLRPIRHDIGHLFGEDTSVNAKARLWIDDPVQTLKVHHWLPVATCIARLMLKNEFPKMFLAHLDETGKDRPIPT